MSKPKGETKSARARGKSTKKSASAKAESHAFQAEVARLLHLMVHSVYSETEIFLRELISNAADACDKLRYEAITAPELTADDAALSVVVAADPDAKTITVSDNGIGMNHDDLVENLGTIARSGTRAFLERAGESKGGDLVQIGQFGVGFYSAFMVADRVEVFSARAGEDECWKWSSDGAGSFEVEPVSKDADGWRARGTEVRLHVKEDAAEYLDKARLESIVRAYSDHIAFPIELVEGEEGGAATTRQVNAASALWARPKSDITPEQYKEFYGHIAGQFDEPSLTIHYRAEGRHEYSVLLFVPSQPPFDLFDPQREARIKLYVKRVFITDDAHLLPSYLRFVRGVVDSEDMPLNISREMLQNNPMVASIRQALTKRVLSELEKSAEKDAEAYASTWAAFGSVLKEGLYEDMERRDQLLALARFATSTSGAALRSLKDYVADLKENQTAIYYIAGQNPDQLAKSPQLEGYRARGVEVLLLSDPVDNFWTTAVTGFDGKPFKSVTQGAADLEAIAVETKADEETPSVDEAGLGTLLAALKQALGDAVTDVRRSERLRESPVCLVSEAGGMDRGLERILAHQRGSDMPERPRILEINPAHELIAALAERVKQDGASAELEDAAWLLYDQARLVDGEAVSDAVKFGERLTRLMARGLNDT